MEKTPSSLPNNQTENMTGYICLRGCGLHYAGRSDRGQKRPINEDSLLVCASAGVFAVADGLGGLTAGEVASGFAVDFLQQFFMAQLDDGKKSDCCLAEVVTLLNRRLFQQRKLLEKNMATTIAMIKFSDYRVAIAHVGDSRVYQWRNGGLERLTSDHSLVNELRWKGVLTEEQAVRFPQRHVITRAIGAEPEVDVSVVYRNVRRGDAFLVCSDGVTTMLSDTQITSVFNDKARTVSQLVDRLILLANAAGGYDNISAVVVQVE